MDDEFLEDEFSAEIAFYGYSVPGADVRPPEELYGAFRRLRDAADSRAGWIAAEAGALDIAEFGDLAGAPAETVALVEGHRAAMGEPLTDEGRLVLSGDAAIPHNLYAVPTTTGCMIVVLGAGVGSSAGAPGVEGVMLGTTELSSGGGVAYGLVADGVVAIDVVTAAGDSLRVRLGGNGFAVRLGGRDAEPLEALVLHRPDGSASRVSLNT